MAYLEGRSLKQNFLLAEGTIVDIKSFPQGGNFFASYTYKVNGKYYSHLSSIPNSSSYSISKFQFLKSKVLQVVYQKNKLKNSQMLFRKKEYSEFNIPVKEDYLALINKIDSLLSSH